MAFEAIDIKQWAGSQEVRVLMRVPMIVNRNADYFLLTDKTVAVVGNALSLFSQSYGSEIDSHDVVIRMNRAAMLYTKFDAELTHGTKTTAWCVWRYNEYEKVELTEPPFVAQMAWWLEPPKKTHVHVIENHKLLDQTKPYWPSTGLMVLEWLCRFNTQQVDVYGFDWKATPTFTHAECVNISAHDFEKEKELCYNYSNFTFKR